MSSGSTGRDATIRILLLDGTPEGLRLIDKSNWNGLAMMCSRAKYPEVRNRDEFTYPGVCLLYSASWTVGGHPTLHVGQADNVREQLDDHNRTKEFWTHLAVFARGFGHLTEQFSGAQAQYLESRLIGLALKAQRAEVINGNAPRLPSLSELDRFESESFLDQVLLLCPLLGLDFFTRIQDPARPPLLTHVEPVPQGSGVPPQSPLRPVHAASLRLVGLGASATGRAVARGIEVFVGSIARAEPVPSFEERYVRMREDLEASGILARSSEGLVFTRNHTFRSPSAAAIVLLGRTANGRTEWKDEQGRTLKQLQKMGLKGPVDVE